MKYMQGVAKVFQPSYWFDQASIAIVNDDYLILHNHSSLKWVLMPADILLWLRILHVLKEMSPHPVPIDNLVIECINKGQGYEEGFTFTIDGVSAYLEKKDVNEFTELVEALSIGVSNL